MPLTLAATGDRAGEDPDPEPEDEQVGDHLAGDHQPRRFRLWGVMSPNPTVVNTVTVKYIASVRVRWPPKLPGDSRAAPFTLHWTAAGLAQCDHLNWPRLVFVGRSAGPNHLTTLNWPRISPMG